MRRNNYIYSPQIFHLASHGLMALADVRRVRRVLHLGGAVVAPSDTGYAIVTLPFTATGRRALSALTVVQQEMTPLAFGSAGQVRGFLSLGAASERVVDALCPGPVTLVTNLPDGPTGGKMASALRTPGTLGLRIPASAVQCQLSTELGQPLTTAALRDDKGQIVRDAETAIELIRRRAVTLDRPDLVVFVKHYAFAYNEHSTVVELIDRAFAPPIVRTHREGALDVGVITRAARTVGASDVEDWT
jgi:tRNA A37 threonylcarbamoyladenosine synthetase subunit TsaC/SUA5/YrdC